MSSISLVWAAETQKRALDSMMGVAGKPTTTVPMFLLSISRPNALKSNGDVRHEALRDDWISPNKRDPNSQTRHFTQQKKITHPILAGMYSIRGTTGESSLP